MSDPLRLEAGEADADEILSALQDGRRVVVVTEVLGSEHEVALRHDGEQFYCDTPTTLHTHETVDGMRECLEQQGYVES